MAHLVLSRSVFRNGLIVSRLVKLFRLVLLSLSGLVSVTRAYSFNTVNHTQVFSTHARETGLLDCCAIIRFGAVGRSRVQTFVWSANRRSELLGSGVTASQTEAPDGLVLERLDRACVDCAIAGERFEAIVVLRKVCKILG